MRKISCPVDLSTMTPSATIPTTHRCPVCGLFGNSNVLQTTAGRDRLEINHRHRLQEQAKKDPRARAILQEIQAH